MLRLTATSLAGTALAAAILAGAPVSVAAQNEERQQLTEEQRGQVERILERREEERQRQEEKEGEPPASEQEKPESKDSPPPETRKPRRPPAEQTGESGVKTGEFNLLSENRYAMLRMTAMNDRVATDMDAVEGGEFVTDVELANPTSREIDRVRMVIDYNPAFVEPISINDSALLDKLGASPIARVDRALGQIFYEVDLANPVVELDVPLIFITWIAKKPVLNTGIRFGRTREGLYSELYEGESKVLGAPYEDGDGTVSLGLRVIPSDQGEALLMQEEPQLYLGSDERVGGVLLAIRAPEQTPRVGEPFTMDIVMDNLAYSQIDGLSMMIQFDPEVLTIVDSDLDNWITLGTNILDGPSRTMFPWDYHMANAVYGARGLIEYRVGTSYPDEFLGATGVIATIHAVAKRPTAGTSVRFAFARQRGQRTTEASYLGEDVLGDTTIRNDGVKGAYFPVLPE